MANGKKRRILEWKYCECGCKGFFARIGPLEYWVFYDLKGGYHLYTAHRAGIKLGCYATFEEADSNAVSDAKPKIQKRADEIKKALKILGMSP